MRGVSALGPKRRCRSSAPSRSKTARGVRIEKIGHRRFGEVVLAPSHQILHRDASRGNERQQIFNRLKPQAALSDAANVGFRERGFDIPPLHLLYVSAASFAELRFGIEPRPVLERRAALTHWL